MLSFIILAQQATQWTMDRQGGGAQLTLPPLAGHTLQQTRAGEATLRSKTGAPVRVYFSSRLPAEVDATFRNFQRRDPGSFREWKASGQEVRLFIWVSQTGRPVGVFSALIKGKTSCVYISQNPEDPSLLEARRFEQWVRNISCP